MSVKTPREARRYRHFRVRRKVEGTQGRPRLCVFRSLKHIYAQVIDDARGSTLAAASSQEREVRTQAQGRAKVEVARQVGALISQRARGQGIEMVVFDRGGYQYHGRVKALAEAAREGGLNF